jgi:hypothetical protein
MKTKHLLFLIGLVFLFSCKKEDSNDTTGGTQSAIGAVNNTFSVYGVPGVANLNAKVISLDGGVSSISLTATVTDNSVLNVIAALSGSTTAATSYSRTSKYIMTSEGITSVYPQGNLPLVKYGAKVGDKWSLNIKNSSITRTVTSVSTTDDYYWNGLMIKTIKVEETGRGLPGVTKIVNVLNHKFGLVGVVIYMDDGTNLPISVVSAKTN